MGEFLDLWVERVVGAGDLFVEEVVAECGAERLEPLCWHRGVAGESEPQHWTVGLRSFGYDSKLFGIEADVRRAHLAEGERLGWLREDRSDDGIFTHHGEPVAAGEAHADEADSGPAVTLVQGTGKGAEPYRCRSGVAESERMELSTDTRADEDSDGPWSGAWLAWNTEHRGNRYRHSEIDDAVGERHHGRGDSWDLGRHQDARPGSSVKHLVGNPIVGERFAGVVGEWHRAILARPLEAGPGSVQIETIAFVLRFTGCAKPKQ